MPDPTAPTSFGTVPYAMRLRRCTGKFLRPLLLGAMLGFAGISLPTCAMTLIKCKVDGKVVYSDTDCTREVRIKNDSKPAKPRIVKIRKKTAFVKAG